MIYGGVRCFEELTMDLSGGVTDRALECLVLRSVALPMLERFSSYFTQGKEKGKFYLVFKKGEIKMKIVIVSDTHFGDEKSTLITLKGDIPSVGSNFDKFLEIAGQGNDYLVLAGDIIDLSIRDYRTAFECARMFFNLVKMNSVAERIIYVPGNHDFDIWHTVEYQTNIINPLIDGGTIRQFRMSVPGVLDARKKDPVEAFSLPTVTRRSGENPYGGLFLDQITRNGRHTGGAGAPTTFYFAYPNLYFVTPANETILITHGQYFETYWSLASRWLPLILGTEDLSVSLPLDLEDLVSLNFPLSQLACSGTGQAGPLTPVIRKIVDGVTTHDIQDIKRYLDRLGKEIDNNTHFGVAFWKEIFADCLTNGVKKKIINLIEQDGRKNLRDFDKDDFPADVKERMKEYLLSSLFEIDDLNNTYDGLNIPPKIKTLLFGHTHHPIAWSHPKPPVVKMENPILGKVKLLNTGGWLQRPANEEHTESKGAEVFIFDSDKGFRSERVNVYAKPSVTMERELAKLPN